MTEQGDDFKLVFPSQVVKAEGDVSKSVKNDELLSMK
jgi:hypothetical protein